MAVITDSVPQTSWGAFAFMCSTQLSVQPTFYDAARR